SLRQFLSRCWRVGASLRTSGGSGEPNREFATARSRNRARTCASRRSTRLDGWWLNASVAVRHFIGVGTRSAPTLLTETDPQKCQRPRQGPLFARTSGAQGLAWSSNNGRLSASTLLLGHIWCIGTG